MDGRLDTGAGLIGIIGVQGIDGNLEPQNEIIGTVGGPGIQANIVDYREPPIYEGPVSVTPTKATQTLHTIGTLVGQDIQVEPIPAQYHDMTVPLHYLGTGAEWVEKVYDRSLLLKDTSFGSWTASGTAASILASVNAKTFTADMANKEYLLRWRILIDVAHTSGATLKATIDQYGASLWQSIHRRPYGFTDIANEVYGRNYCTTILSPSYVAYYNSSGSRTWTTALSYGLYGVLTAATFASATADSTTVTIKTPTINARCSSTYFATGRKAEVDADNTTIRIRGDLFKTDLQQSIVRNLYGDSVKVFNDGVDA